MASTFVLTKLACTFSFSLGILYYRNRGLFTTVSAGLTGRYITKTNHNE